MYFAVLCFVKYKAQLESVAWRKPCIQKGSEGNIEYGKLYVPNGREIANISCGKENFH